MTAYEHIRGILVELLVVSDEDITPDALLRELADEESLTLVEFFAGLEYHLGTSFGDDVEHIRTVKDLADYWESHRQDMRHLRPASGPGDNTYLLRPS